MQKKLRTAALVGAIGILSACGGGGDGGSSPVTAGAGSSAGAGTSVPDTTTPGSGGNSGSDAGNAGNGGNGNAGDPTLPDTGPGSVITQPPVRMAQLPAAAFTAQLRASASGQVLLQVAGTPRCDIDVHYLDYRTLGGQGEPTTATAAVMVPSGADPACNGPRPVVLYAHGTDTARNFNMAAWVDPAQPAAAEGALVAATYAAQGFIVVAPNYAGYDTSTLAYHPYLNGKQQGRDMVDALTAARKTFASIAATDAGTLLITGYSQGGYVALAAHREMQALGRPVTASAPMSAPSAISLLIDATFVGAPPPGSTFFLPLLTASWQKQFGDLYGTPAEVYEDRYAARLETLLPNLTPLATLFATGQLPTVLYASTAVPGPIDAMAATQYGPDNLVRQSFLTRAHDDLMAHPCPGNARPATAASLGSATPLDCQPALGLRKAAVANDLRNWVPTRPVLMCGGAADPTVSFLSTRATAGYFAAKGMPAAALQVLDLEDGAAIDAFSAARAGFAQSKAGFAASVGGSADDQARAVAAAYHGGLVPSFCFASARGFFQGVLAAGG